MSIPNIDYFLYEEYHAEEVRFSISLSSSVKMMNAPSSILSFTCSSHLIFGLKLPNLIPSHCGRIAT